MAVTSIMEHGAKGDGETNDAAAIQAAIEAVHASGGGRVVVPAGRTYLSGGVRMKAHVDLHLEPGAVILGSPGIEDYPGGALIEADGAHGMSVTGAGAVDGNALAFALEELPHIFRMRRERPRLVRVRRSDGIAFRDVTLRNSASWCLHLSGCDGVLVSGLTIRNGLKVPNCDGVDPDHCRNVRVAGCRIECGDDCVVVKNTKEFADCGGSENIVVTGCTLVSTSAALKIGTESHGDFRNILFDSCVVSASSRGLAVQLRDWGSVENVVFSNMIVETRIFHEHDWWGKAEPVYVTALHRTKDSKLGRVRNVRFVNVLARGEAGVFVAGSPDSRIEDLLFDNVKVRVEKWTKHRGGWHDRRPCPGEGVESHPTAGFYVERAKGVTLRDCEVAWGENPPMYFSHAIEMRDVQDYVVQDFKGTAAHPDMLEPTSIT